jgi:Uncharacterized protein conserved in bacteria
MKKILTLFFLLASLSLSAQVYTGIDMLERYGFEELRGKRVGLVTNPSAWTATSVPPSTFSSRRPM